jgi:ATPase components of ABC transporters with duplicated ATPase domains
MVISHDREFLDGCIDHVLAINRNSIEIQSGNYSSWYQNKLQKDQLEFNENHKLIKEISRLKDASKETKQWSDRIENTKNGHKISGIKPDKGYIGHQSAKMMKKSKNLIKRQEKLIEEKERLLKDIELQENLFLHPLTYPKKEFIKVNHLSFNYGDKNILQDLSFVIKRGDRISINGENGSGKSTLFNCLIGKLEVESSMILKPKDLKISYVPQEIKNLKGSFKEYIRSKEIDETLCRTLLAKLNISKDLLESDIESYSDGQKKKLLLSISLATKAHLYIWDEPMNYIDVISREQIEKVILDNDITLIFVEHDNYFKKKIANKNIEL